MNWDANYKASLSRKKKLCQLQTAQYLFRFLF